MLNKIILDLVNQGDLEKIKQAVLEDIKIQELKKDGKYKYIVTIKKILKIVDEYRLPQLNGIWYKNDKTELCNSYLGVRLNQIIEPINGIKITKGINMDSIFNDITGKDTCNIKRADINTSVKEIKSKVKINKSKRVATENNLYYYEIAKTTVNILFLQSILDLLGDCEIRYDKESSMNIIYLSSDQGDAILCPVRC